MKKITSKSGKQKILMMKITFSRT